MRLKKEVLSIMKNREIKFRIWDTIQNKWNPSFVIPSIHGGVAKACYLNSYIYQQSTGLKDKNGREIYEGDVIQYYKGEPYEINYEVKWAAYYAGFELFGTRIENNQPRVYINRMDNAHLEGVVIGNIFENPELLS